MFELAQVLITFFYLTECRVDGDCVNSSVCIGYKCQGKYYKLFSCVLTHYHDSNLIWRTVSRRVDEVIPSDHPRRVASRVIQ